LQNNTIEVELYQSYAASETEATIFGLVGITCDVVVAPASGIASATNPIYTLTGCYLESHSPINASLGELSSISLVFAGGDLTKARMIARQWPLRTKKQKQTERVQPCN
jgi:hypothetical protein